MNSGPSPSDACVDEGEDTQNPLPALNELGARKGAPLALLIGPEGGLGDAEIQQAEEAGYESLRLGPRVLRTETAPLAAIAILQGRWGDM